MFFIEMEFDADLVHWAVTEYIEGRRNVIEDGREPVVSDAMHKATNVIESFAPEWLV
jgi:hypothetical protein